MPLRVFKSIDELKPLIGQEVGRSDWLEVSQQLINAFADLIDDRQWIHIDPERAKAESPFGGTIAHGFFTLSQLSRLAAETFRFEEKFKMAINYGLNRVRFPAPVPVGSRIQGKFTLQSLENLSEYIQLVWVVTVEVEGREKPGLVAEWVARYYRA
jgi:acyl dehydratase